ncbi:zinc finger, CCCH-type, Ankyrin repeat-containing domain protein [Artemisia annua]|uniref:Zinc finger, CCCH-type, Ankyrin repeat-containing domain protein n=1 Tax=Artemisia annua TaxID=35608 RepID=A0A2U1NGT4_ARTAN|nr:zinc finger, CCCH-type, Ankyrin repeat-containing domain protein [Artemisia annua]
MCKGSKSKFLKMEGDKFHENKNGFFLKSSVLLELAATDDVSGFVSEVETNGVSLDDVSFWYGRRNGFKGKMGFEERTPLMIAALYGSVHVLKYIIGSNKVDVNKCSDSDGATALHCAAAGGAVSAVETVRVLLEACADLNITDDNGNKPVELIARGVRSSKKKVLEMLLSGLSVEETEISISSTEETDVVAAKKEYPIDVSMPDINEGVYGTDEFRMYMFKVKPCSRAYSHDWTECPFVHPGENARRRDPRKHQYTCVPCPEFRKGSCVKGDTCEYAHGVFESWLHPAQYRTRLCKDETGCARKVCFFAHKVDELRPLYASTGSAVPSPKSGPVEMGSMSPLGLGSMGSTPPMSPSIAPVNNNMWQNKFVHVTPPALQLPGSRLKTSLNARDLDLELEMLQRQQMIDDLSSNLYNNSPRFGEMTPTNLEDVYGSPSRQQMRQNSNQLRSTYPSSPGRKSSSFGFDSSAAVAQAVMNSRSGSFAKQRSQSFIDRSPGNSMRLGSMTQSPTYSEWGSPDGKLDWGFNSEDASKLRKSASFGFRGGNGGSPVKANHESHGSWDGAGLYSSSEKMPQWVEQMYIEQEQLMA